jgi:hypothetical protein
MIPANTKDCAKRKDQGMVDWMHVLCNPYGRKVTHRSTWCDSWACFWALETLDPLSMMWQLLSQTQSSKVWCGSWLWLPEIASEPYVTPSLLLLTPWEHGPPEHVGQTWSSKVWCGSWLWFDPFAWNCIQAICDSWYCIRALCNSWACFFWPLENVDPLSTIWHLLSQTQSSKVWCGSWL